jgi:hypothetical protein
VSHKPISVHEPSYDKPSALAKPPSTHDLEIGSRTPKLTCRRKPERSTAKRRLEAVRCSAVLGQVCLREKAQAHPLLPCCDLGCAVYPQTCYRGSADGGRPRISPLSGATWKWSSHWSARGWNRWTPHHLRDHGRSHVRPYRDCKHGRPAPSSRWYPHRHERQARYVPPLGAFPRKKPLKNNVLETKKCDFTLSHFQETRTLTRDRDFPEFLKNI